MADDLDDVLDGALGAAFGGDASSIGRSVLKRLARPGVSPPRVVLRDEGGAAAKAPPPPKTAEGDSRYRILGEIARGGVGIVLRSHDVDLGRDVALKILRDEYAEAEDVLQRFVEEAQIGGQLQHPGIVPVYEMGLLPDGKPFFTMKLVKGRTLAAVLAERPDPAHELARHMATFAAVCQTMAYAHARGVIHRDLKPANVMLGAFGEVHVVDWGMGKVMRSGGVHDERKQKRKAAESAKTVIATLRSDGSGSDSVTGSVMGTPRYMPPEQARGDIARVDARSDVFSLGAILCEVLTGRPPYVGGGERDALIAAAQARLDDATAALDACGADEELVRIVKTCLAPAQDARFPDAGSLAKELAAYEASLDERTRAAESAAAAAKARVRLETRRRKLAIGLGSAAAVLVCGAGVTWTLVARGESRRREEASRAVATAVESVRAAHGRAVAAPTDLALWDEVRAALKKAESAATSSDAGDEARASVEALRTSLADGEKAARELKAKYALEDAVVVRVNTTIDAARREHDYQKRIDCIRDGLAELGVRADEMDAAAIARAVRDGHPRIADQLQADLLRWAMLLPPTSAGASLSKKLAEAAALSSPDPVLARIQTARTPDELRRIVESNPPEDMAPGPVRALVDRFDELHATADAFAVADRVSIRNPQDYGWHTCTGCHGAELAPPPAGIVAGHAAAMRAMRPQSSAWVRPAVAIQMNQQNYAAVIATLEAELATHPNDVELTLRLSQAYGLVGRHADAIPLAEKAVAAWPKVLLARDALLVPLINAKRYDAAKRVADETVRAFPEEPQVWLLAAFGEEARRDLPAAEADVRKAIAMYPRYANAYLALARLLDLRSRPGEALEALRQGVAAEPGNDALVMAYAPRLRDAGRTADAEEVLRKGLVASPANPRFRLAIAQIQFSRGEADAAMATMREAAASLTLSTDTRRVLVNGLVAVGRIDEARQVASRAVSPRCKEVLPLLAAASLYGETHDWQQALDLAKRALAVDAKSLDARGAVALYLGLVGRRAEAMAAATELLQLDPDRPKSRTIRSALRLDAGDRAGAIADAKEAVQHGESDPEAWRTLGQALLDGPKPEEAIAHLRRAVAIDPASPKFQESLAAALLRRGAPDEAVAEYRKMAAASPYDETSAVGLGKSLLRAQKASEAATVLRAAATKFPTSVDVQLKLAVACLAAGDERGGWAALRETLRLAPDAAEPLLRMAQLQQARGRTAEALALTDRVLAASPHLGQALFLRASLLAETGELDAASGVVEAVTKEFPEEPAAWLRLSGWRGLRGDLPGSEAAAREGIAQCNDVRDLQGRLGAALLEQGKFDEALEALDAARNPPSADGAVAADDVPEKTYSDAKRRADLRERVPAIVAGKPRPTPQELLDAAYVCTYRSEHATAVRLFAQAFAADPSLAQRLTPQGVSLRFEAARAAAVAARSRDSETSKQGRARALEWLRAEHAASAAALAAGGADVARKLVPQLVSRRLAAAFSAVRDESSVVGLPAAEQAAWKSFWAEADKLLADARAKGREEEL